MNFTPFKEAVQKQFAQMVKSGKPLLRTNVTGDALWAAYLNAFPPGTNPQFRERTEHDCSCCRHFIKNIGGVVITEGPALISIWDIKVGEGYQPVADALANLVKSAEIDNVYLHAERTVGTDKNFEQLISKEIRTWDHFFLNLPGEAIARKDAIGTKLGEFRSTYDVMFRALNEIPMDSIDTVLELIDQNSLYRGTEHKATLSTFKKFKTEFDKIQDLKAKKLFCWTRIKEIPAPVSHIRGSVIGTLLVDLSEGKEMDDAVKAFEAKVAPANYKRPTALVTKAMIAKAKETITEIGLTSALERRYAKVEDIAITDLLFADRSIKKKLDADVFDEIVPKSSKKNLDKVEEVNIEDFIKNILPKTTSLEVMVENPHLSRLVSLIAPCDPTAKPLFKWSNNFSWSYTGDFADSVKERVKKAGGKVDGDLRCSLSWFNYDDLDLHMIEPGGNEICYSSKVSYLTRGSLDVDMNAGFGTSREAVENICYPDRNKMKPGDYKLYVNNYCKRESKDVGFEVEIEFDGNIHTLSCTNAVPDGGNVQVATINYSKENGFKLTPALPSSSVTKEAWGVKTQGFTKVTAVMLSPNYWGKEGVGNKHYLFMLEGCQNDGTARGFYNEFLSNDLNPHRKVLEIVGSKMHTEKSENQLSGIGFSSTQKGHLFCKVKGAFTRVVKVIFN